MSARVCFLGHSTVLIEIDGMRVLTDPVLRPRIGHLRRIIAEPRRDLYEDVDLVLVSHAHHDHLDRPSLRRLADSTRAICAAPAMRAVASSGLAAEAIEPGSVVRAGPLEITATDADHDGRRWPLIGESRAVGFVVRGGDTSVYFAGDTGLFPGMSAIGPVDVALLPVSGWGPSLPAGHLGPEEAAEAAGLIAPRVAVPIHWGTMRRIGMRAGGPADEPARRFLAALPERAPAVRGELIEPGGWLDRDRADPAG